MTVELDGETLTPEDVAAVARDDEDVSVPEPARERVRKSRERIADVLERDEPVYGVNTGFGELVDQQIPGNRLETLQTNLLRSHAAGTGRELTREEVRATLAARVNALVTGHSGVREVVVDHLVAMLNGGVHPVVKSRGSLGASGDLAPLAHASLVLIGEGEADVDAPTDDDPERTRRLEGAAALEAIDREPLTLAPKEGLALINGTQLTTGLAALAVVDAESLASTADVAGALTTEVTLGTTASAEPTIHDVRPHDGQRASAATVRRLTAGSDVVEAHRNCDRVQDAYSLRCLPQVHGAVRDAVSHLREAVEIELNSATDNPLVFDATGIDDRASGTDRAAVLSGGNFHGEPLALRLEYVRLALTELATISERRIDRLVNPNLQEPHLPPFLAPDSGVQSGYMIAQYTAAAAVNELRATGTAVTDNTPVSGGQEDHVSMSATAAFAVRSSLESARTVLATELVCGAQAREYVGDAFDDVDDLELGAGTDAAYDLVRELVAPLETDRPVHADVEAVVEALEAGLLEDAVTAACPDWLERSPIDAGGPTGTRR
ncbi:histidine ammonia-lyase [Natrialbaceae archaeon AArc-T1-2]|uniref:histidine ammonia-lyase n=1 Tax=Natrialbaceae archaeon AArc-T1-2 TaxID=3053904 RepID=UPI00255A8863|nr:histidine ammonia-lyase [Natrialbaceae archaeon AArc-T1-2]WIV67570.1 histidine ammonia-lyase [Natrialbaceae archaeon AArc-T1-2]